MQTQTTPTSETPKPAATPTTPVKAKSKTNRGKAAKTDANTPDAKKTGTPNKTQTVLALLRRKTGASVDEMITATGWQAHSVRGFLSGTVKKKLGLELSSETDDKGDRRYRIVDGKSA